LALVQAIIIETDSPTLDDIAYSTHDIEDGMKAGKIRINESFLGNKRLKNDLIFELKNSKEKQLWENGSEIESDVDSVLNEFLTRWTNHYEECHEDESIARQELKSEYVNDFVESVGIVPEGNWFKITFVKNGTEDTNKFKKVIILKKLVWVTLVNDIRVQRLQKRGENIINGLWDVFIDEASGKKIVPYAWVKRYEKDPESWTWERFVADYISGMTDAYAEKLYKELFGSQSGNIYGE
jgi:dGTPase